MTLKDVSKRVLDRIIKPVPPAFVERRNPANAELRRQIDAGVKEAVRMQLSDGTRRQQDVDARIRALQVQARQLRAK